MLLLPIFCAKKWALSAFQAESQWDKSGCCCGCSIAEPISEGGGECWQPSNQRMLCQTGVVMPHSKVWWYSPAARCSAHCVCYVSLVYTVHLKKGPLFHKHTLPICWTSVYLLYMLKVLVSISMMLISCLSGRSVYHLVCWNCPHFDVFILILSTFCIFNPVCLYNDSWH